MAVLEAAKQEVDIFYCLNIMDNPKFFEVKYTTKYRMQGL